MSKMNIRIKLFQLTEIIQATALRVVNDKDFEVIKISVYGFGKGHYHIEFNYDIKFRNEEDRDLTFNEITPELLLEDVVEIIKASNIPMLIS